MAFDGLVTFTILKELQNKLIGGKIDKIFQPNSNEVLLGTYCDGINYTLDIVISSNHYRICTTTSSKTNPMYAPNFCMVLRKHLLNTRISKINITSLERIVTIEFEGHSKSEDNGTKKLIIELMGKYSNVILLNSKDVIIDSLKHFHISDNSYRDIVPNSKYIFPLSNKLDFMQIKTAEEFYNKTTELNTNNCLLSDAISNTYTGISKTSILAITKYLNIDNSLSKDNMDKVYLYLKNTIENSSYVTLSNVLNNDFSIKYNCSEKENPLQANFFVDDYYSQKEIVETFTTYRNNLSKLILNYMKKLNQKLVQINNKLEECKNANLYRLYGELITNNLYRITNMHLENITLENYYENNELITIPLDKTISPSANAKNYFKKYNKLKNAKLIVENQKNDVENQINYLESIVYAFQVATTVSDIDDIYNEFTENVLDKHHISKQKVKKNKTKKNTKIVKKIGESIKTQVDGFTVLIGKNNKQNDYLTKQANPEDIWFHVKDNHGSHVILKTENKVPTQDTINRCASLAAFYSKAQNSSNVPVDYTYVKYVKKPSNAKPGMVIYTNYKNVIVKPKD